jgi:hypothetical protein
MVEERRARLEADGHGGAVDFHEDVVGEVGGEVEEHHPFGRVVEARQRTRERRHAIQVEQHAPLIGGDRVVLDERLPEGAGALQRAQDPAGGAAREPRHRVYAALQAAAEEVMVIAGEELVAAVAGEGHGGALPRQSGDEVGGERRRVGERLVVDGRQLRDELQRLGDADDHLVVPRAEVLRDLASVARLVEAAVFEADGEGVDRPRGVALHERGDETGVDAAGEEDAQRHIGDHAQGHGVAEEVVEGLQGFVLRAVEAVVGAALGDEHRVPVLGLFYRLADGQDGPRHQLLHAFDDRPGRGDVAVARVERGRFRIDDALDVQRVELRGPLHAVRRQRVVERLYAGAVTDQRERALVRVPEGEGEHADRLAHRLLQAPLLDAGEQYLRVRVPAPGLLREARAEALEVEDLTVEDQDVAARS